MKSMGLVRDLEDFWVMEWPCMVMKSISRNIQRKHALVFDSIFLLFSSICRYMKTVSEKGSPFVYPRMGKQQLCSLLKDHLEEKKEYCDIMLQQ